MSCPDCEKMVYVVEEQANPSTDYFVRPALLALGCRVRQCGPAELPTANELTDATVLFVRYVPAGWARLVEAARPRLGGLVFFMDDDVLDVRAAVGMPWRYRLKLALLAARHRGWLERQGAELWVSTPGLQQKYAAWQPRLVLPTPVAGVAEGRRVFYHGTASHGQEIRWLRPVVETALGRDQRLCFEIVGGPDVHRLYRGLPRVTVIHPLKWPEYQAFLVTPGRHVGLAPLLDAPFNRARSYTKFFDITRCGAVGIYSPGSASAEVVSPGRDGLVVNLDPEAWVEAILRLARDEPFRLALLAGARAKQAQLAELAQRGYATLFPPRS